MLNTWRLWRKSEHLDYRAKGRSACLKSFRRHVIGGLGGRQVLWLSERLREKL